jgi:hypothetical protein
MDEKSESVNLGLVIGIPVAIVVVVAAVALFIFWRHKKGHVGFRARRDMDLEEIDGYRDFPVK